MKNILIIALIVLSAFLAFKLLTDRSNKPDNATVKIAQSGRELVETDVKNISKKVDERGIERALFDDEKQVISGTEQLDSTDKKELDSVLNLLKIKDNQIVSLTSVISRLKSEDLKAKNVGDSIYSYKDQFASISFNRPNETFSLLYDAKIDIAEYWKRNWFLGSKKRYVELWMTDPRASINGVKRLRIEPKPDNFGIKIKGIADYSSKHKEYSFGGGIEIETRRIEYQGNYLYDLNTNKWYPGFRVDLKLLEF